MDRNNRRPDEGMPANNRDDFYNENDAAQSRRNHNIDDMFPESNRPRKGQKMLKRTIKRSLFKEYLHSWYVWLITLIMCVPAYMIEIFLGSLFVAKNVPAMVAALLSMFLGGFIACIPLLILNIYLIVKKKKYYAIGVQIIAIELLGLLFYLYSKVAIGLS